jgi:hypothetical protein
MTTNNVYGAIVERARKILSAETTLEMDDFQIMRVVLASGMRSSQETLEFVHTRSIAAQLVQISDKLAITEAELPLFFGSLPQTHNSTLSDALTNNNTAHFKVHTTRIEEALTCTLEEQLPSARWASIGVKCLAVLAVNMVAADEALLSCLGSVIRHDSRRVDDMKAQIEDAGVDIFTLVAVITWLSTAVVTL